MTAPRHSTKNLRVAYSAGGVIYRNSGAELEVAMIATQNSRRWGLPKGHIRRGEAAQDAAAREIAEETGLFGDVTQHLTTIEYWFRAEKIMVHKYVELFLVRYVSGTVLPQQSEVDDARWFSIREAIRLASFPREREVLVEVERMSIAGDIV